MKVRPSVKKLCNKCYGTVRNGVRENRCKKDRRHNTRQG